MKYIWEDSGIGVFQVTGDGNMFSKTNLVIVFMIYSLGAFLSNSQARPPDQCATDEDCPVDHLCVDNMCYLACETDEDCADGLICKNSACQDPDSDSGGCHTVPATGVMELGLALLVLACFWFTTGEARSSRFLVVCFGKKLAKHATNDRRGSIVECLAAHWPTSLRSTGDARSSSFWHAFGRTLTKNSTIDRQ